MVKKLLLDIGLAFLLFLGAAFLAGVVSMKRPDCVTCGATVGSTVWLAGVLALQPVIWVREVGMLSRCVIWGISMLLGVACYIAFEYLGARLLASGNGVGLNIAFYANTALIVVAVATSAVFTRLRSTHANQNRDPPGYGE